MSNRIAIFFRNLTVKQTIVVCSIAILIVSAIPRFWPYNNDENYTYIFDERFYIEQAKSYQTQTFYFNIHPPLGKIIMFISAKVFAPNDLGKLKQDEGLYYSKDSQSNLSLRSFRLPYQITGALIPMFTFLIIYNMMNRKNLYIPLFCALLLSFDTTLIMESRIANLSQLFIFFMLLSIIIMQKYLRNKTTINFILIGLCIGLAISIKYFGISLIIPITYYLSIDNKKSIVTFFKKIAINSALLILISFTVLVTIFFIHFRSLNYLSKSNIGNIGSPYEQFFYEAAISNTFKKSFLKQIKGQLMLTNIYSKYLTNPDQFSSKPIEWLIMSKPIGLNMKYYQDSNNEILIAANVLIANPITWVTGLFGIIMSLFILNVKQIKFILCLYLLSYIPFFFFSFKLSLYHYIPAMVISIITYGIALTKLYENGVIKPQLIKGLVSTQILFCVIIFFWYSPLIYQRPLTVEAAQMRELFPQWQLIDKLFP